MRTWYILTSVILCLVLAPMVQANAVFWDLLIQPTITNDPVPVAGNPALSGIITDHGGDAVIGANVSVRTLGHTAWLETDEHGRFAYSFNETTTTTGLPVLIHRCGGNTGCMSKQNAFADVRMYHVRIKSNDGFCSYSTVSNILPQWAIIFYPPTSTTYPCQN